MNIVSKAAHTPGPWEAARKVEEHDDSTLDRPYFSIDTDTANQSGDRYGAYIARVDGLRGERQEANARLIAAAPEMLEACSYAFVDISAVLLATEWELAPAVRAKLQETAEKCGAAIQKARGAQ